MSQWKRIEPATAAKLEANRANAQKSTGPRTDEGKARSSRNALKHGLSSRDLVIRPEEREEFNDWLADYRAELDPQGPLEEALFNQIVYADWNLARVRRLEAELFTGQIDPLLDQQNEAKLDRLARYSQCFERTLHRSINELRRLQTDRAARAMLNLKKSAEAPALADVNALTRTERTHQQARTEYCRATLGTIDLEVSTAAGRVPKELMIENVPRVNGGRVDPLCRA
jgi:hypothetical protein